MGRLLIVTTCIVLSGCTDPEYSCSFSRMQGTFHTTESQLKTTRELIFVTTPDGKRTLAFSKRNIESCREL